jgi:hypothetical protein
MLYLRYIFVYSLVDKSSLDQLYGFIDLLEQVSTTLALYRHIFAC